MSESVNGYMDAAFELAREALAVGEVPVGCILYLPGIMFELHVVYKFVKYLCSSNSFRSWRYWDGKKSSK